MANRSASVSVKIRAFTLMHQPTSSGDKAKRSAKRRINEVVQSTSGQENIVPNSPINVSELPVNFALVLMTRVSIGNMQAWRLSPTGKIPEQLHIKPSDNDCDEAGNCN
jgi:hypothetical protein